MSSQGKGKQPITLIKTAISTLFIHPAILFPYAIIAFYEFLIFELLFFAPRYPLVNFFGPIIRKLEGDIFLHYPFSYYVLAKWFQSTLLQSIISVVLNSFFIGMSVAIINAINNGQPVVLKAAFKRTLASYVHLFIGVALPVATMIGLSQLHELVINRALIIRSTTGIYYVLKQAVLLSIPYFNLLLAVFSTALFIYVIPSIIIDKKKIFGALVSNFKILWKSSGFTFLVLLLPALLYLPVILLQSTTSIYKNAAPPELLGILALVGIILSIVIDIIHYTTMTTYYLLKKEEK
ncbi:MAG TPA: hypothetical protein PLT76_04265 [Candidatus Omnitrophota bacterium]|nr:hypothetical protein [Candidatus Omnitrophota bacterium]HQO57913.1 hypothetical protein [Candidatus Omnitrophota bacterium]